MLGDGKGQFSPAPGSPFLTGKGTWHLAIIDVNGDGLADVVTSNLESKNVSVLLGNKLNIHLKCPRKQTHRRRAWRKIEAWVLGDGILCRSKASNLSI